MTAPKPNPAPAPQEPKDIPPVKFTDWAAF